MQILKELKDTFYLKQDNVKTEKTITTNAKNFLNKYFFRKNSKTSTKKIERNIKTIQIMTSRKKIRSKFQKNLEQKML